MRDNLILYGLNEPQKPKPGERPKPDNCEELVKTLISDTLDMETKGMEFRRVHTLGGERTKKPCPIIVNVYCRADREKVRLKAYEEDIEETLKDLKDRGTNATTVRRRKKGTKRILQSRGQYW